MVIDSEALNTKQAAALCGLKPQTMAKRRIEGRGPKWHRDGRRIIYFSRDLGDYLRSLPSGGAPAAKPEAGV
jgi:hypothetical protein